MFIHEEHALLLPIVILNRERLQKMVGQMMLQLSVQVYMNTSIYLNVLETEYHKGNIKPPGQ